MAYKMCVVMDVVSKGQRAGDVELFLGGAAHTAGLSLGLDDSSDVRPSADSWLATV